MKNYIINIVACFLLIVLSSNFSIAQMEAFNYQGIAVDDSGEVISSTTIGLQFSIIEADPANAPAYVDSHSTTTTSIGHFTADIGKGSVVSGNFAGIDWSSGAYFLKVELDADGGTNYTYTNTIELLSVPYALVVENSENTPVGRQGQAGLTGAAGATGIAGAIGPAGYNGGEIPGPPGEQGDPGPAGFPGPDGPDGDAGAPNGAQGPKGDPGPKGSATGDQGAEGAKGPTGAMGPAGPEGPAGEQGDPGPSSNEVGPKGPVGPPGEPGGAAGLPGPDGPSGANGAPGPQGATGPAGFSYFDEYNTLTMYNVPPTPGPDQNIYVDDGTNTADGKPGIRFYNGTEWIDL